MKKPIDEIRIGDMYIFFGLIRLVVKKDEKYIYTYDFSTPPKIRYINNESDAWDGIDFF